MTRKPTRAAAPRRILIGSHSHPAISKGGAEIAAQRHLEGMRAAGWEANFLGCAREPATRAGAVITQPFGPGEYLYTAVASDWFKFSNPEPAFPREFRALLRELRPDVVHLHHYAVLGVESFLHIRETLPDARIVLTIHEFQAICNHYGQMVRRDRHTLCRGASLRDCNRCFPDILRSDFYLREAYIKRFFDLVDAFVAPSRFLADRYVAWGLDAAKMHVIENITAPGAGSPAPPAPGGRLRVGFFGQISSLKGIDVLLDAAELLEDDDVAVQFDIHGDPSGQPPEFQEAFAARLKRAGRNVRHHGPYDNDQVDRLMRGVDAVVIPSIWWENSPVVIQECRRNRRPVICSDIGGMAEKVRDGLDGLHFPVGDAVALADVLAGLAAEPERVVALAGTMQPVSDPAAALAGHLGLYG